MRFQVYNLPERGEEDIRLLYARSWSNNIIADMMSLASRPGALSSYMQATAFAVAGPLKALIPGVVVKDNTVLLNPKKQFMGRESLSGQSPKTGPAVTVSINGECVSNTLIEYLSSYLRCFLVALVTWINSTSKSAPRHNNW